MLVNTVLVIVLSVVIGWIRGGRLNNLVRVEIRYIPLAVGAFFIQFLAIFAAVNLVRVIDVITYAVILVVAFANRKITGILLALLGTVMNYAPILANGGRMPVYVPYAKLVSSNHAVQSLIAGNYGKQVAMSGHTHLNFLGDLFYLGSPFPNPTLLSAGDIVIAIGVFLFVQMAMKEPIDAEQGDIKLET